MTKRLSIALLVCALAFAAHASAETAYVTDRLQLGLHVASDTSDRPFANLPSGTRLEVLERKALYARVRTPTGDEGWVKSAFIVAETPARFRLDELEAELADFREQLAESRVAERRAVEEAALLRSREAEASSFASSSREKIARLERENDALVERLGAYRGSLPIAWVAGALLVAFAAGGGFGWWVIDALSRRRHAGYRVY